MIRVVVLAGPDARVRVGSCLTEACDVDVQPVAHVNPARVDDVHAVAADALVNPWVDVEQVFAPHGAVGGSILVPSVVEVLT